MRVTMINKYYPPHIGGIEFHVRDISEALARTPGVSVRAIVSNEAGKEVAESIRGVDVHRLPRRVSLLSTPVASGMCAAIRDAAAACFNGATCVFHVHFPYPWGEVSWLRAGGGSRSRASRQGTVASVPTVVTYHSDIIRQRAGLAAYRPVLERFLDRVDLIIASSPQMVEHSEFLAPRAHKCRVVPFGIDVDMFAGTPEHHERARQLKAAHSRPVILFVGRLVYYKGIDVLVKAMRDVAADLVVIGAGPLSGRVHTIAMEAGVADRLTIIPPQPLAELVAWYHAADVVCMPSVARSEAFGLVQLEAHAAGTPVVSTRLTTGVPFVNQDGVTGLTVDPGDVDGLSKALETLVDDPALRARYGSQARERAHREFTTGRMVADTLAVYREAQDFAEARRKAGGRA